MNAISAGRKNMIDISVLIVMQDELRVPEQIEGMIAFVKSGGRWKLDGYPIYISRFPDGAEMIHDGHHRIVATWIAGRQILHDGEYFLKEWTYEQYNSIFFERGYVTPHDPRTHVRTADFLAFKREALDIAAHKSPEEATTFIHANRHRFCRARKISKVSELAEAIRLECFYDIGSCSG